MNKASITRGLQWMGVVVSIISSFDALLAIYKTFVFRGGIEDVSDFYWVVVISIGVLLVALLTGAGALFALHAGNRCVQSRMLLIISILLGCIMLIGNFFNFPKFVSFALWSKSETLLLCLLTSGAILLTQRRCSNGMIQ
jgi:hypothetical protein